MAASLSVDFHVRTAKARARVSSIEGRSYATVQVEDQRPTVGVTFYFDSPEEITRIMRALTKARRDLVRARTDVEYDRPRVAA